MDNPDTGQRPRFTVRTVVPRLLKACVKTTIIYLCLLAFAVIAAPVQSVYSFQPIFTAFLAAYLLFIFVIEMGRGTIYQYVFGIASSMTAVLYFAYLLNTSVISVPLEQAIITVNAQFFFYVLLLGGVLGLVKSILRLLNWINEKEESWLSLQVKSL
jgi:hypothetical protein